MTARALVLCAATLWAIPASADVTYSVIGAGKVSCGSFITESKSRGPLFWSEVSWIEGYVSGANGAMQTDLYNQYPGDALAPARQRLDFFRTTHDTKAMIVWMESYCRAHPLNNLADAASALAGELLSRSERSGN